jgi:hypothetical protein
MTRALSLALLSVALASCAIADDDAVAGIGAPCEVSAGLCPLDLVCMPDEPGASAGVCAPLVDFGTCGETERLPGRFGTVESAIAIDEAADTTKLKDVRLVEDRVTVHNRVREVDLGDACAFRALQRVGDGFYFGNTDVTSLDGMQSLTSVKNAIAIFGNRELESLDGLASLVEIEPCTVDTRSLQIVIANNDALPASAVTSFLEELKARFGKAPQAIRCGNGPSSDEDPDCGALDAAVVVALQDGEDLCE